MQSSIVHKLLTVLSVISEAQKPLTFSEVVEKTGLNKSTVHRLLAIATDERMVRHDSDGKVYVLGSRVFDLVRNAYSGYDIQSIALDEMVRLFELSDANVTLGVPSGLEVIYLRIFEAPHSPGSVQRPGMREPVHCSASGKALLAFLPDKLLQSKLREYNFTRYTDRTLDNAKDFAAELDLVRRHGFAKNDREEHEHVLGISAPVFNYVKEPIAVLNIWSTRPRHSIHDLLEWSDELKTSAKRVSALIGGVTPEESDLKAS